MGEGEGGSEDDEGGATRAEKGDRLILGDGAGDDDGDVGHAQAAEKGGVGTQAAAAAAAAVWTGQKEQRQSPPRIRSLPEAVAKLDSIINSPPLYSKAVIVSSIYRQARGTIDGPFTKNSSQTTTQITVCVPCPLGHRRRARLLARGLAGTYIHARVCACVLLTSGFIWIGFDRRPRPGRSTG